MKSSKGADSSSSNDLSVVHVLYANFELVGSFVFPKKLFIRMRSVEGEKVSGNFEVTSH